MNQKQYLTLCVALGVIAVLVGFSAWSVSLYKGEALFPYPLPYPPEPKPIAPSDLAGKAVFRSAVSGISLTWKDNSSNERIFFIRRRVSRDLYWPNNFFVVLPANTTSYFDSSSLTLGTTYEYIVWACNRRDDCSSSNIAKVLYAEIGTSP